MTIAIGFFLFLIGAAGGSFVGAMTWRINRKMDFIKSRSICEHCKHQLSAGDLIPILSWLILRGKCRYCEKKIGWLAVVLEVGVGLAFVVSYLLWPSIFGAESFGVLGAAQITSFVLWLIMVVLMAALLVYDARWRLLPNKLLFPLIGVAAAQVVISFIARTVPVEWWSYSYKMAILFAQMFGAYLIENVILALLPVSGVYLALYLVSRGKWIGFGDVKFGLAVALILADWRLALTVLIGANLLGSLVMLPLLVVGKKSLSSKIAFGPFLIAATFLVFLFSPHITNFIDNFFLYY
ncbi:prepilin peptidase [Candidatus Saccharibacteria bacterium]|nr:prepilin peptidase [Candidatus Saccharibacteria bacterium]